MRTLSMLFLLLFGMSGCQPEDDPIIPTPTPDFNASVPPYSFYTEVYYTLEQGIVGFQGQNDEFWGLKGYE